MERKEVPPAVWVLSGAAFVSVTALTLMLLSNEGRQAFFSAGDSKFFLLVARDPFGTGHGFAALHALPQVPYRYGRIGMPLVAWLLAAGQPGAVAWTLIALNVVTLTAIPGLAAFLLAEHDAPPMGAAFIIGLPAFLFLYGSVVSDPLVVALILLAYLLDARSHRGSAVAVIAAAILVKEIAVLALVPLAWRAARNRDWKATVWICSAVVPYAAWCVWVRVRIGTLPFLASTESRKGALGLPFAGIRYSLAHHPFSAGWIFTLLVFTLVLGGVGAWVGRGSQLGLLAALFTALTICLGPEGLRFIGEVVRVFFEPEVFGLLALVAGLHRARRARDGRNAVRPFTSTTVRPTRLS